MKNLFLVLLFLDMFAASAQPGLTIIPRPREYTAGEGVAYIDKNTRIILEGSGLDKHAAYLNAYLQNQFGFSLSVRTKSEGPNEIHLNYERLDYPLKGAYTLSVELKGTFISGDNEEGVFYGIQTLVQLLPFERSPVLEIPFVFINDGPRFEYRGMHLDVSRHIMPVEFIKRYIDYLALHKLNVFHWHLTDDQGWRLEIKKYPKLTREGALRYGTIIGRYPGKGNDENPYSGYYTQEQVKEIVQYAADRYITVIPEIELPGHCSAAIAAYPELSCFPGERTVIPPGMASREGKIKQETGQIKLVQETWGVFDDVFCPTEYTFRFLADVLDEVMALFPSKYIHIGGDECPKTSWKRSAYCQQLMRDHKLPDEHGLQSYFVRRIEEYVSKKGKSIIGWDEILDGGLAPGAVLMCWNGETVGINAVRLKHRVIMTPQNPLYFDYAQSKTGDSVNFGGYNPVEKVYDYEPVPKGMTADEASLVLGAQANVWTEYMTNPAKVEYMIFPRMAALSEVLWSPREKKNYAEFEKRLEMQFKRYDFWGANYSKAYYDLNATVIPAEQNGNILWKLETKFKEGRIDVSHGGDVEKYSVPVNISATGDYAATLHIGDKQMSAINQHFSFNKATGRKIILVNPPSANYPGDGAFTLVNAVQNEKGLAASNEFLGFLGTDLDAVIDLGRESSISKIRLHVLHLPGSWIYLPSEINVTVLQKMDTSALKMENPGQVIHYLVTNQENIQELVLPGPQTCRYLRIVAKNIGIIPEGNPGAGARAWLFADEIEVE